MEHKVDQGILCLFFLSICTQGGNGIKLDVGIIVLCNNDQVIKQRFSRAITKSPHRITLVRGEGTAENHSELTGGKIVQVPPEGEHQEPTFCGVPGSLEFLDHGNCPESMHAENNLCCLL